MVILNPKVAVVVATYAAVPYIHLHLEAWRRFYPGVAMLVHDDGSPHQGRTADLCHHYGAAFSSNAERRRHCLGDMSAYARGLAWAEEQGADLLVKLSRRFLPVTNWVPALAELAEQSQHTTYSGACEHFNFGFLTECIGFHVSAWRKGGGIDAINRVLAADTPGVFVEGWLHQVAKNVSRACPSPEREAFERGHPRREHQSGYAAWSLPGTNRMERRADRLWHDPDPPQRYADLAESWGMGYSREVFKDPNMGLGIGKP